MKMLKEEPWRVTFDRESLTRLDAALEFIEGTLSAAQMAAYGRVRPSPAGGAVDTLRDVTGLSRLDVAKCEVCEALILPGDRYCGGEDVDLCEDHAPTYAEALAEWRSLCAEDLAEACGAEALASCERAVDEGRGDEKILQVRT